MRTPCQSFATVAESTTNHYWGSHQREVLNFQKNCFPGRVRKEYSSCQRLYIVLEPYLNPLRKITEARSDEKFWNLKQIFFLAGSQKQIFMPTPFHDFATVFESAAKNYRGLHRREILNSQKHIVSGRVRKKNPRANDLSQFRNRSWIRIEKKLRLAPTRGSELSKKYCFWQGTQKKSTCQRAFTIPQP